MSDGALRKDVLDVLVREGIEVETLPANRYRISRGDALLTVRLQEVVSRTVVNKIERRFGVSKTKFFPPLKLVSPDLPKVVPIAAKLAADQD